ncbi:MAG: AlkZ family DNA glycosylase [Myxococcales bacterium]|nr:AlkZ family DNA glycosylase [Myxococcales bacterium]
MDGSIQAERPLELAARRLLAQQIAHPVLATPAEVVAHLGALQAQDYAGAKWAVGLRLGADEATDALVERALDEGSVLRTHALRGTWQLIAPADVRWTLSLVAPRVIARAANRYRQLELEPATVRRSNAALAKVLADGAHRTRGELAAVLERAGIATDGQRLAHLLARAELDAVICSGARRGKHATYALLDDRVAATPTVPREEALARLAARYFRSRGPATVQDLAWWSGLPQSDARHGLESIRSSLVRESIDGRTYFRASDTRAAPSSDAYLLPAFDEYLVAYRDRSAVLDPAHVARVNAGGGMLDPCVVVGGRVVGTWRRTLGNRAVAIEVTLFGPRKRADRASIAAAANRYGRFLGVDAVMT